MLYFDRNYLTYEQINGVYSKKLLTVYISKSIKKMFVKKRERKRQIEDSELG